MKVLHVCFDFPYPPTHGGRVDMWARILALRALGCEVDLVVTTNSKPSESSVAAVREYVRSLMLVPRVSNWRGILSFRPGQYVTRHNLASIPLTDSYDVLLMECESTTAILGNPSLNAARKILRVHNDEADYMRQMGRSSESIFHKLYFWQEARRYKSFTARVFERVDNLWFISEDYFAIQPERIRSKSCVLPGGIDAISLSEPPLESRQVLFVGTLTIPTNQEAIRWYLDNIHYRLLDIPQYVFFVAGSSRGQDIHDFMAYALRHPAVRFVTDAPDLGPLYEQSRVFVNPMRSGNSVKIKTLNAAQRGLPIVTTSVGNEGTGFKNRVHVLVADDVESFISAVRECLLTKTHIAENAKLLLAAKYDQAANIERALTSLPCSVPM